MIANRVDPSNLNREDALEVASMLERTGRAVDPRKWIDEWRDEAADARNEAALKFICG